MVAIGFTEVQTYSYYSTLVLNALGFDDQTKKTLVKVANPISAETEYLRHDIWPNLVEVISKNAEFADIAIFEIGKVYEQAPVSKASQVDQGSQLIGSHSEPQEGDRPKESSRLSIALTNGTDNPTPELYQMLVDVLEQVNVSVDLSEDQRDENAKRLFHPTRFSNLLFNGQTLGGLAEVHPRILNKFGIDKRAAIVEIDLEPILME